MAEMTFFGGAKSGLPIPKLMIGAPVAFIAWTSLNFLEK
jgi:hypothetical protein